MVSVTKKRPGSGFFGIGGGGKHRLLWYLFFGCNAIVAIVFLAVGGPTGYNDYDEKFSLPDAVVANANGNTAAAESPSALASTTTILEPNEPDLHETATVMAMATGYKIIDYHRFVGSLRKTGYKGNIILVVAPDIRPLEEAYLKLQNVTMHKVQHTKCTHNAFQKKEDGDEKKPADKHRKELMTCVHPYPNLKHRWARFPLLRDLLEDCGGKPDPARACGGPVLITDMRDTFFQRNPFGPDAPKVHGLQVFEEHYTIRTTHWLVDWPVHACKKVRYDEPMLCSGTTIGTRRAMLDYLGIFHGEMDRWMADPSCHFDINGDDQSMHNYLYYSGMLTEAVTGGVTAVKNRDGLVHTVGAMGSLIFETHKIQKKLLRGDQFKGGNSEPFDLSAEDDKKTKNWLGLHYGLTDRDGYFVQYDGSRSYIIHQYDRFGMNVINWMTQNAADIYG